MQGSCITLHLEFYVLITYLLMQDNVYIHINSQTI